MSGSGRPTPESIAAACPKLLPQHARLISDSGISPEVAVARGYLSVRMKSELRTFGFGEAQRQVPALLIPVHNLAGDVVFYQARPDVPRIKDGKALKYETPLRARMALDVPPGSRSRLGDPSVPLFITEGIRKADSAVSWGLCCLALLGVWNWRGTNAAGGKVTLAEWESIALNGRQVYIVFDSDVMLKPEVHGALARLKAFLETKSAKVALIYLPAGDGGSKVGLDDYLAAGRSVDELLAHASSTLRPIPNDDGEPPKPAQGRAIVLESPEPWAHPVDGAALLDELVALYTRFVALPDGGAEVQALWVAHTYAAEAFDHTPYLAVVSATKRCGKTTNVTVIKALATRALSGESITPSVMFRVIERQRPTLLIDELDRVAKESEVWGILNSGHARGGAVFRSVGDDHEPREFSTYCPKLISYIRGPRSPVPDTVEDRSIRITVHRQSRGEKREKIRTRELQALTTPLRQKLARWASDNKEALSAPPNRVPEELDDRAADCWEPLFAIADAAGGRWSALARHLAVQFSACRGEEEIDSPGVLLLLDLGSLLDSGELTSDDLGIPGKAVVQRLLGVPDRPWGTWGQKEKPITEAALARLLRPFGIRPELVGPKDRRRKRYTESDLRAACARYTPSVRVEEATATLTPSHPEGNAAATGSAVTGVMVRGLDTHQEGSREVARTRTGTPEEPDDELVVQVHRLPADAFERDGVIYRVGDVLPSGQRVLIVEDGVPTLTKRLPERIQ